MSRASGVSGAFGKFVAWLLAILLILGVAAIAVYFVMREQGVTYYVEFGGERYFAGAEDGGLELMNGETHEFSVKSLTGGEVNYSVKVVSSAANNFRFSVGTEMYWLYNDNDRLDDYSNVFSLQKSADSFSITIPQDFTVEQALETKYGGDITFLEDISENESYFTVVVTVDNSNVALCFSFGGVVESITLNPPSVIF